MATSFFYIYMQWLLVSSIFMQWLIVFFYIYVMATSFFYIYVMATSSFYIYVMATSFFYIYKSMERSVVLLNAIFLWNLLTHRRLNDADVLFRGCVSCNLQSAPKMSQI